MKRSWMFLSAALLVAGLGGCPKPGDPKDPNSNGKKGPVPTKDDPSWKELEAIIKDPSAAKDGACEPLSYLNANRARQMLARCVEPLVLDPKANSEERRGALELLAEARASEAVPLLKQALGTERAEVRYKAAEALLRLKDPSGVELLLGYRGGNGDRSGASWLVRMQEVVPAEVLKAAAASPDDATRRGASILLGVLGAADTIELVANLAIDSDPAVQAYAGYAQARFSSPERLLEEIKKELKSSKKTTRFGAAEALGYYGGVVNKNEALTLLAGLLNSDPDPLVQEQAAYSLLLVGGPEAGAALVARLNGANGVLSGKILSSLAALRDPSTVEPLLAYSQKADLNSRGQDLARCFLALQDPRGAEFAARLTGSNLAHLKRAGAQLLAAYGTKDESQWKPLTEEKDQATKGYALIAAAKGGAKPEVFSAFLNDDSLVLRAYAHTATMIARSRP